MELRMWIFISPNQIGLGNHVGHLSNVGNYEECKLSTIINFSE